MYLPKINEINPDKYLTSEKFRDDFQKQIKKDFLLANIQINLDFHNFLELKNNISETLNKTPTEKIFQLLYILDLKESEIKSEVLVDIIIRRIIQKLIIRNFYKP
jgi:hypothetical protein